MKKYINEILKNADAFRIQVTYITSANNVRGSKEIIIRQYDIDKFRNNPELLMTKTEYNKHVKEQQKEALANKQHDYYEIVNRKSRLFLFKGTVSPSLILWALTIMSLWAA